MDLESELNAIVRRPDGCKTESLVKANIVARCLDVSEARVYEMAKLGIIPCVRLGRLVRFRMDAIEAFVEQGGAALPGGWRKELETAGQ